MTDKELRRLNRAELLQLLYDQGKELERVQKELEDAKAELKSRRIAIHKVGSIAEASIALNQVFEAAQRAADQFLENAEAEYNRRAEKEYGKFLEELEARRKADGHGR